jgi:hypothetical protein
MAFSFSPQQTRPGRVLYGGPSQLPQQPGMQQGPQDGGQQPIDLGGIQTTAQQPPVSQPSIQPDVPFDIPATSSVPAQNFGTEPQTVQPPPPQYVNDSAPDFSQFNPTAPTVSPDQPFDINRVMSMYSPEHAGIDALYGLASQQPLKKNYHPSLIRKILGYSAQAMGGGPQLSDQIINYDFNKDNEDWLRQFGTAREIAGQERSANAVDRQFLSSLLVNDAADKRVDAYDRAARARETTAQFNADTRRMAVEVQKFKIEHPDYAVVQGRDGRLMGYNPKNLTTPVIFLQDSTGADVLGGKTTPQDALDIGLARISAQEEARLATLAETAAQRRAETEQTFQNNLKLLERRETLRAGRAGASGGNANVIEQAITRNRLNNAQKAILEHPEWEPYIDASDPDNVQIMPPNKMAGNWFTQKFGAYSLQDAQDIYNKIAAEVLRGEDQIRRSGVANNPDSGTVRVVGPPDASGKPQTGSIPRKNVSTLPPGWKVVEGQ